MSSQDLRLPEIIKSRSNKLIDVKTLLQIQEIFTWWNPIYLLVYIINIIYLLLMLYLLMLVLCPTCSLKRASALYSIAKSVDFARMPCALVHLSSKFTHPSSWLRHPVSWLGHSSSIFWIWIFPLRYASISIVLDLLLYPLFDFKFQWVDQHLLQTLVLFQRECLLYL